MKEENFNEQECFDKFCRFVYSQESGRNIYVTIQRISDIFEMENTEEFQQEILGYFEEFNKCKIDADFPRVKDELKPFTYWGDVRNEDGKVLAVHFSVDEVIKYFIANMYFCNFLFEDTNDFVSKYAVNKDEEAERLFFGAYECIKKYYN